MTFCDTFKQQKDILKRHSIYIQENDADKDFEFFVFMDAGNEEKRPLFLQALRVAVELDSDSQNQVEKQARADWDKRFEDRPSQKLEFNLLNWLKIAIEDYPYRLFVVINPEKWSSKNKNPLQDEFWYQVNGQAKSETKSAKNVENGIQYIHTKKDTRQWMRSKFIYKRICWINNNEIKEILEDPLSKYKEHFPDLDQQFNNNQASLEYFKLWLYLKWIQHVAKRIRELKENKIHLYFHELKQSPSQEQPYYPATLPEPFKITYSKKGSSSLLIENLDAFPKIRIQNKDNIQNDDDNNTVTIAFIRHTNVFRITGNLKWYNWLMQNSSFEYRSLYGEFLSGNLSYLTHIFYILENPAEISSYWFFLQLIEQALLRLSIIDERIQEWYNRLKIEAAGFILQQRVFVGFLNDANLYDQKDKPAHGIYAIIPEKFDSGETFKLFFKPNTNFKEIFKYDTVGIDVLIVHQGVLDKWSQSNTSLNQLVLQWKDEIPFVGITSGRGTPSNLPCGVKFLPFSGLESCMKGTLFEKLVFMRQLFSIKQ